MRSILLASAAALALNVLGTQVQAASPNLIANGDFEAGTANWTRNGSSILLISTLARTGDRSGQLALESSPGTLSQDLTLAAGTYTVQFYYAVGTPARRLPGGLTANVTLTASFGGTEVANLAATSPTTDGGVELFSPYQRVTQTVTVGAGTHTLLFNGSTTATDFIAYFIDDVSVRLVALADVAVTGTLGGSGTASTQVATDSSRGFMETVFGRLGTTATGEGTTTLGFGRNNSITVVALQPEAIEALGLTRSDGSISGDGVGVPYFWVAGFGGTSKLDKGGTLTSDRGGTIFGADMKFSRELVLGVSAGFGAADFGLEAERNGGRSTEAQAGLYGMWKPAALDGLYLNGMASYGQTRIKTYRSAAGAGGQQQAAFTIPSATLSIEACKPFDTQAGTVTPFARGTGTMLWRPSYTETQVGVSGLNAVTVEKDTIGSGQSVLGARIANDVDIAGRAVRLSGELGWAHQFNSNPAVTFRDATTGVTQSATGIAPPADTAQVGVGARLFLQNGPELFTTYSGQSGSAYQDHILFLGARFAL